MKLTIDIIHSRAFAELTGSAIKVFLLLMTRKGTNKGAIPFSLSDGIVFGFGKNTTKKALDELQEKGFIERTKAGVNQTGAAEWLLSSGWKRYPERGRPEKKTTKTTEANDNTPAPGGADFAYLWKSLDNLKRKNGII